MEDRILVTGATGFVGSALVKELVRRNYAVRILTRKSSITKHIDQLPVERVRADVQNISEIKMAMEGCRRVFHVAGLYRFWMKDYRRLSDVNIQGSRNVFEAALLHRVEKVVHTSSIGALGIRTDGMLSDEHTEYNLQHVVLPYEMSKYASELVAKEYMQRGLPIVIVRPALVMGRGDMYPTPSGRLVLNILKKKVPACFDGGVDVADVDDVAAGHIAAMEDGLTGESYNLGTPGNFATVRDIVDITARCGGITPPRLNIPVACALIWAYALTVIADRITHKQPVATPGNIRALALKRRVDFSKAVEKLHGPVTPLAEIIEKTVTWYGENGYLDDAQ